jgi:hypothetical protein
MTQHALFNNVHRADPLQFWSNHGLDYKRVTDFLDLDTSELSKIGGVSKQPVRLDNRIPQALKDRLEQIANIWQYEIPANSQIFGRLVLDAGFDGIIYASRKGPKACVALFPTNFAGSESHLEIADEPPKGATHTRLDQATYREIAGQVVAI